MDDELRRKKGLPVRIYEDLEKVILDDLIKKLDDADIAKAAYIELVNKMVEEAMEKRGLKKKRKSAEIHQRKIA